MLAWGSARGPKATPEETRAQGRETLSFFQGMRREHWDREASWGGGVSGREQEPSTGGDTDNLSCSFVAIWTPGGRHGSI